MKSALLRLSSLKDCPALHPLLFAAYPSLFFYAYNIRELSITAAILPLGFSIAGTLFLFVLLRFILQGWVKAGIGTTLFIFLFFSYGRWYDLAVRSRVPIPEHRLLLPGILLIYGYAIYFVRVFRKEFKVATNLLNLASLCLIVITVFSIGRFETYAWESKGSPGTADTISSTLNTQDTQPGKTLEDVSMADMVLLPIDLLFFNGDFEGGNPPDGWVPNGNVIVSRATDHVVSGSGSVKLRGNGAGPAELFQYLPQYLPFEDYIRGKTFTFKVKYWLPPENTVDSVISIYDGVGESTSPVLIRDGDWHLATVTRQIDAAATMLRLGLKLYIEGTSTADYGYFDAAVITENGSIRPVGNGDFEEGDPPDGWEPHGNVIVSRATDHVVSGSCSVKLRGGGAGPAELFQYLPFEDYIRGKTITFKVKYWLPPENKVESVISIYDGVNESTSPVLIRDGAWHLATVTRQIDAAATMLRLGLKLYIAGASSTDYGYFDAATITENGSIPPIDNDSFEEGDPPDGWVAHGNITVSRASDRVVSGAYSVKLRGGGGGPAELFQYFPREDYIRGKTFTFGVKYWLPQENTVDSVISIYDGVSESTSPVLIRDGTWHLATVTRQIDAAATMLRLGLKLYIEGMSSGDYGYFDEAVIVENIASQKSELKMTPSIDLNQQSRPDIYYIIVDEYASPDTMKQFYEYDNHEFIDYLTSRGFFVAPDSRSRANGTEVAIASNLNMEYMSGGAPSTEELQQMIADSRVMRLLNSQGYRSIFLGSPAKPVDGEYHDFYGERENLNSQRLFWHTTMLLPFYDHAFGTQFENHFRSGVLRTFEYLKKAPEIEGPKFIYAHINCPHWPIVFGANGEEVPPADWDNFKDKQFYLNQYIFVNKQVEMVIDELLKGSATPPIIIVQSDHGLRSERLEDIFDEFKEYGGEDWRKIFNACYLPGMGINGWYSSISPVNTFRIIFNHYFGTHYDLLKD